jgi:hypothetical protein
MLWGAVCGSALGLPYHGRDPEPIAKWPDRETTRKQAKKLAEDFRDRPQSQHGKHPPGAWSGILDPLFLAMELLVKQPALRESPSNSDVDHATTIRTFTSNYAGHLKRWSIDGMGWSGSSGPYELDFFTMSIVELPGYLDNPIPVASRGTHNPNDCSALLRVLVAATLPSAETAERLAMLLCRVTHKSASVTAVGCFIALLLQGFLYRADDKKHLVKYAATRLEAHIQGPGRSRLHKVMADIELQDVGGRDFSGRHLSSVRCFMFTLRRMLDDPTNSEGTLWEETMSRVCREGGSADVNAALAGALLGAQGLEFVPDWRTDLPHANWVGARIEEIVQACI